MALKSMPKGRVHDYSIEYYRKFDSKWNLSGLETKGVQTDTGYVVEGKIPLKSLQDLGLIQNDVMRAGVYRAEFSAPKKDEKDPVMEWISWRRSQDRSARLSCGFFIWRI